MGKTVKGENIKRHEGIARKADAAARKAAEQEADAEASEDAKWQKGAKGSNKKELEAAKKAEAAKKKAERDALLAEEEKNTPGRAEAKTSKTAAKKTAAKPSGSGGGGLDAALSSLDGGDGGGAAGALNASGIDNALDALSLTGGGGSDAKVDRHPERRFKAAFAAFEARRLKEMEEDGSGKGLRQSQRSERLKKEFKTSPENPFNQVSVSYDATRDEIAAKKEGVSAGIEARLASKE